MANCKPATCVLAEGGIAEMPRGAWGGGTACSRVPSGRLSPVGLSPEGILSFDALGMNL